MTERYRPAQPGSATYRRTPQRLGAGASAVLAGLFVLLLWVIEVVDAVLPAQLDAYGIRPRSEDGLWGIVWAPLLHGGWLHLESNSVPLFLLGFAILAVAGLSRWLVVTAWTWIVGGLGTWLVAAPGTVHLGASVLVFGWFGYLAVSGFLSRRFGPVLLSVLVLVLYGGLIWGVLPGTPGISWQGHLFGFAGGVVAAFATRPRR